VRVKEKREGENRIGKTGKENTVRGGRLRAAQGGGEERRGGWMAEGGAKASPQQV